MNHNNKKRIENGEKINIKKLKNELTQRKVK